MKRGFRNLLPGDAIGEGVNGECYSEDMELGDEYACEEWLLRKQRLRKDRTRKPAKDAGRELSHE